MGQSKDKILIAALILSSVIGLLLRRKKLDSKLTVKGGEPEEPEAGYLRNIGRAFFVWLVSGAPIVVGFALVLTRGYWDRSLYLIVGPSIIFILGNYFIAKIRTRSRRTAWSMAYTAISGVFVLLGCFLGLLASWH